MRVAWVIPCRYVEVNEGLATIVGGGIDRLWLGELPAPEPVQVLCAVRIVAGHDEVYEEPPEEPPNQLTSRVYDPSMTVVDDLSQPFALGGTTFDPAVEPAVTMPIGVVFQPEDEGQYTIEIAVDDRGFSVPITIALQGPDGD